MPAAARWPASPASRPAAPALALAAALGALQTLALVHTWAWPLPLAAAAWLARACGRAPPRRAAALGWVYGTAWIAAGTWWLFVSMHRYGGLPAPLAAAAVALLAGALALYLALAMALYARWRRGRARVDVPLFAALWLLAELARGVLFTGFPWAASGYAQVDAPLAVLAPWVGVYGIGAIGAALAALAVQHLRGAAAAAAVLALLAIWQTAGASTFTSPAGTLAVTLLQPAVPQDQKFDTAQLPATLAWLAERLQAEGPGLVVAPETAVPLLPSQLDVFAPGWWGALEARHAAPDRAALVGVPLGDLDAGYTNSVVGLSAQARYRYDKYHLVPFGEFIPRGFRWFTELMHIPLGDFARGVVDAPSFAFAGQRIGPNICYEDLFGEELARRFRDPARAPTMLVNLSNIAWFGRTIAVPQHLAISRLRSLELQRPMLRATNTGATAIVDHRGVVVAQLTAHERGVLRGQVQGREGTTPFAWWASRGGLWPLFAAALLGLAVARPWRRGRRN
ncbi:MAG: apolipoprotein N-acyltransferase [Rhodoferax sp.]|nr:apolipoprotein N-acyltransferase [Rhodoferax sp.]MCL4739970.1 apolipoprotein N-acyltransferase [Burkholderiaceae bacterium]MCP5287832.1 apolipoprotein N-acyltransferase [Burkholderiaceae bacterium]HMQ72379.1 apolipoprotein N-acyltransferase [Rubrivivax sp.]